MPYVRSTLVAISLLVAGRAGAQVSDPASYLIADRAAEIAMARSAGPKAIADSATILVLTKTGFVEAVRGTNGFTCFVGRSFDSAFNDPNFWNPANRGPECLNPPAVKSVLREMLKRAEWVMAGATKDEIQKRDREGYAAHTLPVPAPGAMAYMLSPDQALASGNSHWVPHVMFWFDKSHAPAMGLSDANTTMLDGTATDPDAPFLLLLIPVRKWSDGKLAMPEGAHTR
jgi:hypothetical protein